MEMTVQDLINTLQKVHNKNQIVTTCIIGVEIGETCIVGIRSEVPNKYYDATEIGICWLMIPRNSTIHQ